ncbi:MAG: NAD(+)/NADH kinase [Lachnospiraceae bacterium]|uniref:NAD kinase n=1 Tax=Candidatus Weimeria bifida TaxID=2599074 RepID=A0A6N7J181_9FIRM|nr:NAD(+)/NADH kinase [Candidatus Weimeria bifida]RRF96186.1 MAG: NAD(+)/NADH kinase [Lachnospiraceae bacterium]
MKDFFILTKEEAENTMNGFISEISGFIEDNGGAVKTSVLNRQRTSEPLPVPENTECILTVGGDGTMIRAAMRTINSRLPILGINKGHLGYLCDLDESNYREALSRLFADDYEIEDRMLLSGRVLSADGVPESGFNHALNDIVLTSRNGLQVVHIDIYVNGEKLSSFNGDGVIFATPTGSTAYNLSAGGPIVDPKTKLILMSPLNAHVVGQRSIVMDPASKVRATVTRRNQEELSAAVAFDGSTSIPLYDGESIEVVRSDETVRFIKLSQINFLDRIREKLQAD